MAGREEEEEQEKRRKRCRLDASDARRRRDWGDFTLLRRPDNKNKWNFMEREIFSQ